IAAALDHIRKTPAASAAPSLNRPIIAAALSASLGLAEASVRPLIALLRRLDADAAREDARRITEEITAAGAAVVMDETGQVAPDTRIDTLDSWAQSIDAGFDVEESMAGVDHWEDVPAEDLAAEDPSETGHASHEVEDLPPPAAMDMEPVPSPALARLLMLQGRLNASIAEPSPVEAAVAADEPATEPVNAVTDEAPPLDPDEAYRADLDSLFAATFGDAAEAATVEDDVNPPSAEALRVINSLHDALDAGFFNNWDIRRRDAA
ncbi:MAG TPA: hypothetical protein PLQ11_10670, partial [Beijerinckiaceae bacterium]|nr:hypothetical protein [Beijerinckiaceae bacterium]